MTKYFQYFHIRVDDLSEEQLTRFKDNAKFCIWMLIGEIHTGSLNRQHYHVLFKYEIKRMTSTMRNKFILNYKKIECESYYIEPKYENSTIQQFVDYVKDNGIRELINEEKFYEDYNEIEKEEKDLDDEEKRLKKLEKSDWMKERIKQAKNQNWDWFIEYDINFTIKPDYERLRSKYFKVNKYSEENLKLRIIGSTKLKFFWLYGVSRKGKDSFTRFICTSLGLECFPRSKISPYWNGCKYSPEVQDAVSITEYDGPLKAGQKLEIPLELIKEAFDKEVFAARCAYSFMEVIRFNYGFITSQVHPYDALFPPGSLNTSENYRAIEERFSIINVEDLPELFSIEYNIEKEDWEINELLPVPIYMRQKYNHLVDENGFNKISVMIWEKING